MLHANFAHLLANSLPLLVLGTVMLHLYPAAAVRVLVAVYLGPGIAVWLFGRDAVHIGASGIAYGLVSYILVAGLLRSSKCPGDVALSSPVAVDGPGDRGDRRAHQCTGCGEHQRQAQAGRPNTWAARQP